MARFDVDAGATTYHPSIIRPVQPPRLRRQDKSWVRSIYWDYLLVFQAEGGEHLAAALEEWKAFDDEATHDIILPPPDDVLGGDLTMSDVYIEIDQWPDFTSVNVSNFTVRVSSVEYSSS